MRSTSSNVSSPCVKICKLVELVCVGCGRTAEEIKNWPRSDDSYKLKVLERLKNDN